MVDEPLRPKSDDSDLHRPSADATRPSARLARVDPISVITPLANRRMPPDAAVAPTALHARRSPGTAVLRRLHGSDSDELFGAAMQARQESLIHANGTPRFQVSGKLGEGSQGIVYRVEDRDCHREVACKVLSYSTTDPEEISRFIHEAQVTAQLEHPGIVPIHDLGVLKDGTVFYSMKRIDGESLQEVLRNRGGKPEHRFGLLEQFLKICQTMAFAHSRGVMHRDIKPRNVMVGSFGEVLVVDWGLAKVINCPDVVRPMASMRSNPDSDAYRTVNGTAVGTPAYMSPEQAAGEVDTLDRRCDIYSLGVILYEALAGVSPYVRGEARKVMHQVSNALWTRLDQRPEGHGLPRALVAIVHRALAFDRKERYQTVDELADDLRSFIAGQAVSVYRESTVERLARVLNQNRRQLGAGLAVAAVAAVIGIGVWAAKWYQVETRITELRRQSEAMEVAGDYAEARATCGRILDLQPDDGQVWRDIPRLDEGVRRQAQEKVRLANRLKADSFAAEARGLARARGIDELTRAGELYMQALGLVPDDQQLSKAYREVAERQADVVQGLKTAKEAQDLVRASETLVVGAAKALEWARKTARERDKSELERRALETAMATSSDSALRVQLHKVEVDLQNLEREYSALLARTAVLLDQATNQAPGHPPVREGFADYYSQRLLDADERGDQVEAAIIAHRLRSLDDKGRFEELASGKSWAMVPATQPGLTLVRLEEGPDRTLVATGAALELTPGKVETLSHGRWLARNGSGTTTAMLLRRGQRYAVTLPTLPVLPADLAFIPRGVLHDDQGRITGEIPHFALARREVTCGEWLEFLNDPATLARSDEAAANGQARFVPVEGGRQLWARADDGKFTLIHGESRQVIDPACPVSGLAPRDAQAYVLWRSARDHLAWRLPTRREWQLAVQGGDGRPFPWGLHPDLGYSTSGFTAPVGKWCVVLVGSRARDCSVQGVFDLAGSVAELTLESEGAWSACGGSWRDRQPEQFRVSSHRPLDERQADPVVGFRLALSLPPSW